MSGNADGILHSAMAVTASQYRNLAEYSSTAGYKPHRNIQNILLPPPGPVFRGHSVNHNLINQVSSGSDSVHKPH